jgi:hypothetical protein
MQPPSTAWQWTDTPRQSNLHNLVHSAQTNMPPPMSPVQRPTSDQDAMTAAEHQQHLSDVAGVLRRNQACLNCRRRKLVSHPCFQRQFPTPITDSARNATRCAHTAVPAKSPSNTSGGPTPMPTSPTYVNTTTAPEQCTCTCIKDPVRVTTRRKGYPVDRRRQRTRNQFRERRESQPTLLLERRERSRMTRTKRTG